MLLRVTSIVGLASDPAFAERLHDLGHRGAVETVRLSRADMSRRRQQLRTDRGTELALLLDRDAALGDGSILLLEPARAVVIALDLPRWLTLAAADAPHALELGYFAGNMHWKVRFDGDRLCILLEGPRADYLQRLAHLLGPGGGVVVVELESEPPPSHHHDHEHGHDHGHDHDHDHGHSLDDPRHDDRDGR